MLLALLAYALLELSAWAGLEALRRAGISAELQAPELTLSQRHRQRIEEWIAQGGEYFTHSPLLGWTVKRNGQAHVFHSNGQGIRADRDYAPEPPPGMLRLASFGDSFTHCAEVVQQDTWQSRLEGLDPHIEALNFGVDAYGIDQAYLRYTQDGRRLNPHIVLIGIMSENINRSVSVFRPFYNPQTGAPFAKPRFLIDGGELRLVPNPFPRVEDYRALLDNTEATLRRLGEHDYYFQVQQESRNAAQLPSLRLYRTIATVLSHADPLQPGFRDGSYDPQSEAYRVTERLIDQFYATALRQAALPIVLVFPERTDMQRQAGGKPRRYQPLLDHMERSGYRWLDLLEPLASVAAAERFRPGGHYSPAANEAVARALLAYLRTLGLDTVAGASMQLASLRGRIGDHGTGH